MAKLPTVTSNVSPDLRAFLDRVREAINGTGADSLVSVRQLVAAGVVAHTGTGITGTGGTGPVSPPIRPENVGAAGALANIMVTWNKPIYAGHAYAEIWSAARSTEQAAATPPENPILGQAELVGMAPGVFFAHNLGAGATRFYWVRFVNVLGEVGPYQSTEGILGQTSVDPAYVLEVLTGAITESELYTALSSRIDLIDGAAGLSGSVSARIQTETTSRIDALALKADASTVTTLAAAVGDNTSAVQTEATARAAADGVIEAKYTVKVDVGGHVAGYGLIANANNGATVSEFGIRADQFFLAPPTIAQNSAPASAARYVGMSWVDTDNNDLHRYWSGTAWVVDSPSLPFIVRTSPTTINGEAVPAGVYIRDGFIQNGTIVNAAIGDAAIDNAKIANVNAGKINAGFIDAGRIEAGSIDANKIDTRGLSIKDSAGNIILAAGTPLSVDNYVTPAETSSLFYNSNFTRVAVDGRPAGVYSCNGSTATGNISFQDAEKTILKIATVGADTSVGGGLQAIRVDPNVTYMIYARVKATANKSSGFYMRARELDTELANGVNFIAGSARESGGAASTRTKNFSDFNGSGNFANVAITNSYVDIIGEYQPTSTAKWMSVEFLNWTGMGIEELHIAHCIIATKQTKITNSNVSTFIEDAAITNAYIGNTIQSSAYQAGSAGWKLDKTGDMELNDATFRGTLDITGSSGTNRLELTGDTIKVIDSSNVVRVKIGDLS